MIQSFLKVACTVLSRVCDAMWLPSPALVSALSTIPGTAVFQDYDGDIAKLTRFALYLCTGGVISRLFQMNFCTGFFVRVCGGESLFSAYQEFRFDVAVSVTLVVGILIWFQKLRQQRIS